MGDRSVWNGRETRVEAALHCAERDVTPWADQMDSTLQGKGKPILQLPVGIRELLTVGSSVADSGGGLHSISSLPH
jgi:hypothetical protein